jgi:hypothetical protein
MKNSATEEHAHTDARTLLPGRRGRYAREMAPVEVVALAGLLAALAGACSSKDNPVTGTGGTPGGDDASTGVGGAVDLPTITSDQFGDFDNAFMITPCGTPVTQGYDCPNAPQGGGACPTTQWSGNTAAEPTGNSYTEQFTVTATDPTKIYDITVRVRGQAEGRTYINGVRNLTTPVDPSATVVDLLYTGGQPGSTRVDYNVFQLVLTPPADQAIPDAATYYAFNAVDLAVEGTHHNYQVDETFTMKVKSGFTLALTSHDSNCIAIQNCGPQGAGYGFTTPALCQAHQAAGPQPVVPGVTLPATFRGAALANGGAQPFQTQFLNFRVTSIVAE